MESFGTVSSYLSLFNAIPLSTCTQYSAVHCTYTVFADCWTIKDMLLKSYVALTAHSLLMKLNAADSDVSAYYLFNSVVSIVIKGISIMVHSKCAFISSNDTSKKYKN